MPDHDPRLVANTLLYLDGRPLPKRKLQELVYMAHGWSLAIQKRPLISSQIEAWDFGHGIPGLWHYLTEIEINCLGEASNSSSLSSLETEIIQHIWEKYRGFTCLEFSSMSHKPGTPWSNTYFGRGRGSAISRSEIQKYFVKLALSGRSKTK